MIGDSDVWARLDSLAKPRRSLGKLEELAVRLAVIQQTLAPATRPRRVVLFAGDHGVVQSGVSAWGSEVTALMVRTIGHGRASSTALAAAHECELRLVDVGVAAPLDILSQPDFRNARIGPGTRDLSREPAMTVEEFEAAWDLGVSEARAAVTAGCQVLLAGEMGIGNTTAAACLVTLLAGLPPDLATGRGAGADDAVLAIKRNIVATASAKSKALAQTGVREAIASVAGYEIAAMAGFFAEGANHPVVLLLDGYVATAAALIAAKLQAGVASRMIASHLSAEPGHGAALDALGLQPLLDWNMRLGEGTGALVALPLLDSAAALLRDVATLEELGVPRED
ncbi:MAG: nicotinate-nucleotide--dimethylbenzimidazole phosphoribosyltransferase [Steroidobacteraceae bacterium]